MLPMRRRERRSSLGRGTKKHSKDSNKLSVYVKYGMLVEKRKQCLCFCFFFREEVCFEGTGKLQYRLQYCVVLGLCVFACFFSNGKSFCGKRFLFLRFVFFFFFPL